MNISRRLFAVGTALTVAAATVVTGAAAAPAVAAPPVPAAPDALAASGAAGLVASRPSYLRASADDTFTHGDVIASGGTRYVPYQRRYRGIPVVGGDFVIVTDSAGRAVYHSVAQQHPIGSLSTTPSLSRTAAEAIARRTLMTVTSLEGTELVVDALGASPRLAWESTLDGVGANGVSRLSVDVDAVTGAVLRSQEHVMHGSGTAAWNGPNPVTLNTTRSAGVFSMQDPSIRNLSCQDANTRTTFSGPDDLWGNGDATSLETGCVDALFGAQTEARMLSQWLGRNGMDGGGGAWPIRVGLDEEDAYYDGTKVLIGHNTAGQWAGSIDAIAHEMGHGVDEHTPGSTSGGGTQEFIADAFGAATEWFANEPAPFDVPDFTVGEQVNLNGAGPIRNMYHPSLVNGDPNCYSSSIPSAEVHAAAGPGNHWFYLLAEGTNPTNGQPTSPTCNGSTVTGLGVKTAMQILYNAMLMKTVGSSYLKYRVWTLQAAKNLFPGSCTEFNMVKAAWDAVGVPAQTDEPTCVVLPFQHFLVHASTPFGPTDQTYDFATTDWDHDGIPDLAVIKKSGGVGTTQVYILSGASGFQRFVLTASTALSPTDSTYAFAMADWNRDGTPDLVVIKKSGTSSGTTEVEVLSGASGFQKFLLNTPTALEPTDSRYDFATTDWDHDGVPDLAVIKKSGTDSGTTEVHILSGASEFQQFLLHTPTALAPTDSTFAFSMADWNRDGTPDLVIVKKSGTGTGTTEVHILSGALGFQWDLLDTGTPLAPTDSTYAFSTADWDRDGVPDLVIVKKSATATGTTEVHILKG